jgi:crotonobetainyl-CoA:carnitine CoA-transferase CaiB-like acyl-CoA transferase
MLTPKSSGSSDPAKTIAPRSIPRYATVALGRHLARAFIGYNRAKKNLAFNVQSETTRHIFEDMVQVSGAVVENLHPDAIDNMGLV